MISVIAKVLSFVIVIAIGYGVRKTHLLGDHVERLLSKIVFNITLPATIVRAFGATEFEPALLLLTLVGLTSTVLPYFVSLVLYRNLPKGELVVQQLNVCGFNIGCFALAFIQAFFSPACVVATCLFDAGNALMGTGGTYALTRSLVLADSNEEGRRRMFARTLFSSVAFDCYLVLIAMGLLGIHVPDPFITLLAPMADANAFLSMFMLGFMIRFTLNRERTRELIRLLSWRIIVALMLTAFFLLVLPVAPEIKRVLAVLAWAPIPTTGPLYTMWAGGDEGIAGMTNALSVILGVCIMSAMVLVMGVV